MVFIAASMILTHNKIYQSIWLTSGFVLCKFGISKSKKFLDSFKIEQIMGFIR